jgi:hypothetical protein
MSLFELSAEETEEAESSEETLKEYDLVIIRVFERLHSARELAEQLPFTKSDIEQAIRELELSIKNVPDIVYTYRSGRSALPEAILVHGNWAIVGAGKGKNFFTRLFRSPYVDIPNDIEAIAVLDATPQIVLKYQSLDEQGLLARVRYNRLIDIFTSLTTYHLQGHFRTTVSNIGQVELDDLYIGIDTDGRAFVLPVEAKGESPKDRPGVAQITQMVKFARKAFPDLASIPVNEFS